VTTAAATVKNIAVRLLSDYQLARPARAVMRWAHCIPLSESPAAFPFLNAVEIPQNVFHIDPPAAKIYPLWTDLQLFLDQQEVSWPAISDNQTKFYQLMFISHPLMCNVWTWEETTRSLVFNSGFRGDGGNKNTPDSHQVRPRLIFPRKGAQRENCC